MPFQYSDKIKYYTFDIFNNPSLSQAVFTRRGGASEGFWDSLNVGLTVGDREENVITNRRLSFESVGRDINTMSDSWLIHGTDTLIYDEPRPIDQGSPPKADIILTDNPDVTLFMRYADCVPLFFHDPVKRVVGLAHSGWQGTVNKVGEKTVEAMSARYGSNPKDIRAAVGPSIGPDKYEVGDNVIEAVQSTFGRSANDLLPKYNDSTHFDLWTANRLILEQAGVGEVEVAELCTGTYTEDWFSHRTEKGKTGRFGALLALHDN